MSIRHLKGFLAPWHLRLLLCSVIGLSLSGCAALSHEQSTTEGPSISAIHRTALVLDAHADIALPTTSPLYLGADGSSKVSIEKLANGGVDAIVLSLAAGPKPRSAEGRAAAHAEVMEKMTAVNEMLASFSEQISLVRGAEDIVGNNEAGKISVLLSFQNAQALQNDISQIDRWYAAGVRIFALTHLGHNDFADSSRPKFDGASGRYEPEQEHGGLSTLGVGAVARVNELGAVLDVSQLSRAATLQAVSLSSSPVIASHSNVKALSSVTRNLSDEEIDAIGANGGVIHLTPFSAYLIDLSDPALKQKIRQVRLDAGLPETYSYPYELYWELKSDAEKLKFLGNMRQLVGQETVGRLVDHIDYVVDRIGVEHVGIGSDFNHGGGIVGYAEADAAQNVTAELIARGYTAAEIQAIWSGNFLRVLASAAHNRAGTK